MRNNQPTLSSVLVPFSIFTRSMFFYIFKRQKIVYIDRLDYFLSVKTNRTMHSGDRTQNSKKAVRLQYPKYRFVYIFYILYFLFLSFCLFFSFLVCPFKQHIRRRRTRTFTLSPSTEMLLVNGKKNRCFTCTSGLEVFRV